MPLPRKQKSETDKEFIARCAGDKVMNKEYPDAKQRIAVCYAQLRRSKKKVKAAIGEVEIISTPIGEAIIIP